MLYVMQFLLLTQLLCASKNQNCTTSISSKSKPSYPLNLPAATNTYKPSGPGVALSLPGANLTGPAPTSLSKTTRSLLFSSARCLTTHSLSQMSTVRQTIVTLATFFVNFMTYPPISMAPGSSSEISILSGRGMRKTTSMSTSLL